ncbi:MAG: M15 family metallopeptidase [Balneolaceae bacterium]
MIRNLSQTEIERMITTGVWREECPVHYTRLKKVEVSFIGFDETVKTGNLIVLDIISQNIEKLFNELVDLEFPIYQMLPIEEFGGDDVLSMKANNSTSFNGRLVARTNRWSSHAYGTAIDINPIQNPYLLLNEQRELIEVIPPDGEKFLDRKNRRKGMVEEIVALFAKHGFTEWGGSWKEKPDYHHFQLPWNVIWELFPKN